MAEGRGGNGHGRSGKKGKSLNCHRWSEEGKQRLLPWGRICHKSVLGAAESSGDWQGEMEPLTLWGLVQIRARGGLEQSQGQAGIWFSFLIPKHCPSCPAGISQDIASAPSDRAWHLNPCTEPLFNGFCGISISKKIPVILESATPG